MKYNIKIESWGFANIRNRLRLVLDNHATSENYEACENIETSLDSSNNLKWFQSNIDGVALYLLY